ncbi:MAG: hypothetical protein NTX96_03325 [Candidatus Zambryskibacteria bacterium]|nr:hypothetical protein [Candidatus Zambryskibacteria bacterium]
MEEKFRNFIKITKILNNKNITPVLYGSLGLYQIIKPQGEINDIDFLIPGIWLKDKWYEFKEYLESYQFHMDNEHEHEFSHSDIVGWIAFGSIEESEKHSGLNKEKLIPANYEGAKYLVLSAEQYLNVYKACLKDSYRQEKKDNTDIKKIEAIEEYIRNENQ